LKKAKERRLSRLVLGHLERISGGVFDRFSGVITDLVGGKSGIYALYRNNKLYYVGLATDLKKRLNRHLKDRHKGKWNYFSLYLVRKVEMLKDLESLAIRIAYPKGNKTRGKFGGAPDLRRALKSKIKTQVMEDINDLLGKSRNTAISAAKKRKATKAGRAAAETRKKTAKQIPLKGLLKSKRLRGTYKGKLLRAWVYRSGRIRLKEMGKTFDSPSGAAGAALRGKSIDGWHFWRYKNAKGDWVPIDELRRRA